MAAQSDDADQLVQEWLNDPNTKELARRELERRGHTPSDFTGREPAELQAAPQRSAAQASTGTTAHSGADSGTPKTVGAILLQSRARAHAAQIHAEGGSDDDEGPTLGDIPDEGAGDAPQAPSVQVSVDTTARPDSLHSPQDPHGQSVERQDRQPPKSPRSPSCRLRKCLSPQSSPSAMSPTNAALSPNSLRLDAYPKVNGSPLRESPTSRSPASARSQSPRSRATAFSPKNAPHPNVSPRRGSRSCSRLPKNACQVQRFYWREHGGPPLSPKTRQEEADIINNIFEAGSEAGLTNEEFRDVTKIVVGLPSYCTDILWAKCCARPNAEDTGAERVTRAEFEAYWHKHLQRESKPETRLFKLLCPQDRKYLRPQDFYPLVHEVVRRHPGLSFLTNSPNFHGKYVETVVCRIFYSAATADNRRITKKQLIQSDLIEVLRQLDEEEDINDIWRYFSYEHFYVIYCKFWELDSNHDFLINLADLESYAEYALTKVVLRRVAEGAPLNYRKKDPAEMDYWEFICFMLSEEDKTTEAAVRYWFRLLDMDGDGVLSAYELQHFFREQSGRISEISEDPIKFYDVLVQLNDMVGPTKKGQFRRAELMRCKNAPLFFNMMFNLTKFAVHEQRDPGLIDARRSTPHMTDWDYFAANEYARYAEEEG